MKCPCQRPLFISRIPPTTWHSISQNYFPRIIHRREDGTMLGPTQPPTHSNEFSKCWTCRRRRVTCDGSRPTCFKCKRAGRHCLGYGQNKPLVWVGLARRGKMAGRDFEDQATSSSMTTQLAAKTITDPAFQDLGPRAKQYLFYCMPYFLDHLARQSL